ncbi:CLUMA_CG001274, isoform A [Clunio marinus]|uniref:CLUMA_CG001274, isoform A n=1 Tax=Clunio marinus TaxID=568069 RepID=A0A1J1HML0_9DIPT|nr:CLUMA_CG001274, isoform A [Clunio marinus]
MWSAAKGPTRLWRDLLIITLVVTLSLKLSLASASNELWPSERPNGMPNIVSLEVMCAKDHMDVHMTFSHPFEGIVSSKGQHSDPRCIYVPPSTGKTFHSFRIAYSRCGTKPDLNGQFYENTVVVQYDKDLLEVWDEAKRLRCEWFNDYEKTASKPPMVIADLDVIQLDFRGDNVDCWMEIQHGKGPWAPPVSGIVPLGSTLTLVVAINDFRGEFDMRVKSCAASDGAGHVIKLSDEFGCVLRPKMISKFLKARAPDERATVITYAFFHAFKFPDALSVHIKCKVEICRHGCLDHCQTTGTPGHIGNSLIGKSGSSHEGLLDRKDTLIGPSENEHQDNSLGDSDEDEHEEHHHDIFYDDIIHKSSDYTPNKRSKKPAPVFQHDVESDMEDIESLFSQHKQSPELLRKQNYPQSSKQRQGQPLSVQSKMDSDKFPHGPRQLQYAQSRTGMPIAGPRALDLEQLENEQEQQKMQNQNLQYRKRTKRSVKVTDRKARSADVGVSGLYDVISEADLQFSPDTKQEAVTVFQGKISEEVVYGICMPVQGFSIIFILVISATLVAALVAGSLLYKYQLQKETLAQQQVNGTTIFGYNTLANWMTMRLFRMKHSTMNQQPGEPTPSTSGGSPRQMETRQ